MLVEDPDIEYGVPFPFYAACDRVTGEQELLYQVPANGDAGSTLTWTNDGNVRQATLT